MSCTPATANKGQARAANKVSWTVARGSMPWHFRRRKAITATANMAGKHPDRYNKSQYTISTPPAAIADFIIDTGGEA
jgi:hypothetical protein